MRAAKYKAYIEEISEGYQEARDEEFHEQFCAFMSENDNYEFIWTEDEVQTFVDAFNFPNEFDWACAELESRFDAEADARYEQMKDDR